MKNNDYNGKVYAYIAIGLTAAGAVALGLSFTILKLYALIASVLLSVTALTFVNIQKNKNNFAKLVIIKIAAYVVFGVSVLLFAGGTIWSAV